MSLAVVLAGVLATLGFKDLDRPSATGGPTIGVTSSKASTVTDIDGVTVHPPAFEIVCDPAIDDLGSSESCTTEIQPLPAGENAYITLRLDGITLSDMQRLCRDGYGFWVSDNQAGRAQAQDQLQSPSGAPLSSAASSSYVPPGAVLGSLGDVCPNLLRSSPMNVSNGNVPYIPLNINHYFIAPGPWVIDYRLYSATGELLLSASYKTTVI